MITEKSITDFIYREAELLDTMQWDAWLALFHASGRYWMPLEWQQQDPVLQPSLMYEDLLLLKVRVERLAGERTFSQKPKSRCHHLLQAPTITACDPANGLFKARTSFIYTETRGDVLERYSGWASHDLIESDGHLKIKLKRIDLVNFDAPFGNIQLFM
ncbi:MAG: aromatic-ring-hydroxylating dioxygenase subunit beta [Bradyrhizobium sp.]|jgi:3-phenylpropionate/cinnamic acid dioxygenase small subunit|uniref:Aromatic-ring-hydroxylating dioxygenase subunit beta n=1 Tax=Bradyrhizobium denitrificans TaxID=2734912 RepID=A0ABS5GDI1_9BRAD|nr:MULTISPECIES: aromatic-ring-hydroxylating dioxygenase subunit beta [Bradyrhizobium]ABQ35343.1 putative dioxygenase beta subunit [Bradyrhizobium sp. BTAi1]MBR1139386.1 aromatic-ring-hydroxylating dioxygenase subunit beta [Bradyrhizobium denitrificans]MDU1495996.1 aromatic-ring-hydroxylating dioxygenase subunit beta [Bradyrhizobium sp.]MDU1546147.1 aromatic-ring-hydroxylating dioxygenase subunit beta [Bradyrhizobium sp.]MDU1664727.1 aromatic-ring-hydroxylating dioxygenase subunit beta [Bradyr